MRFEEHVENPALARHYEDSGTDDVDAKDQERDVDGGGS